jgi:hypothetical protein
MEEKPVPVDYSVGFPLLADVDGEEAGILNAAFPPSDSDDEEEVGPVDVRLASLKEDDGDSAGLSASSSYSFQLQFDKNLYQEQLHPYEHLLNMERPPERLCFHLKFYRRG